MRPTAFFGYTDGTGPWSSRDQEMAKALVIHESTLCSGCRHPADEAHDPDREGWYDPEVVICAACSAIEKAQRDDHEPGSKFYAVLSEKYPGKAS